MLGALIEVGAEPQDVAARLHGEREPGDEDLVYLWVRRPLIEWALRRAAAEEPAIELASGRQDRNPRSDLDYLGFNTFRGDNRTYAVIVLVPKPRPRAARSVTSERGWRLARPCTTST